MAELAIEVSPTLQGPARARAALEPLRDEIPEPSFDDVTLVVSELVAEAALTAGAEAQTTVEVRVEASPDAVRVEVREGELAYRMDAGSPRPGERGFGLRVVQAIADRWAVRREGSQAAVLVEIVPLRA